MFLPNLVLIFVLSFSICYFSHAQNHPQDGYTNEALLAGKQGQPPSNRVTITVGEKNSAFIYTANGITYVPQKITVTGEYYNNDFTGQGHAFLFLTVDSGVDYWNTEIAADNRLNVYVENFNYEPFYFEVVTPYPVHALDLRYQQINETTILVEGPSKVQVFG